MKTVSRHPHRLLRISSTTESKQLEQLKYIAPAFIMNFDKTNLISYIMVMDFLFYFIYLLSSVNRAQSSQPQISIFVFALAEA